MRGVSILAVLLMHAFDACQLFSADWLGVVSADVLHYLESSRSP